MLDVRAAQDADRDFRVEQTKIGGDLAGVEIGIVLGVEEARIARSSRSPCGRAARRWRRRGRCARRAGISPAKFERVCARQQHGVAEMLAGDGVAEHMDEEQALIDLMAVLVALVEGVLPRQRFRIGNEARRRGGGAWPAAYRSAGNAPADRSGGRREARAWLCRKRSRTARAAVIQSFCRGRLPGAALRLCGQGVEA